ncbi:MAG: helix-turn-helix transcriptional regulator [Gammaproteobacteria bacterium]|nr:helix-turn-helix transcriptional regulator [Gammaproteobacteria bacterium]
MTETLEGRVDIQKLCDVKKRMHVYFIDTNNVILACNPLREKFLKDIMACDQVVGRNLKEFINESINHISEFDLEENKQILESGVGSQFFQSWLIKSLYSLDLLTWKMPIYDLAGRPMGILVTSHVLNTFSIEKAHALGLTKREIQCLYYLFEGYTAKEIAKIIKLSPRTVEGYVENMKHKLNCSMTSELLLMCMQKDVRNSLLTLKGIAHGDPFADTSGVRINVIE